MNILKDTILMCKQHLIRHQNKYRNKNNLPNVLNVTKRLILP